MWILDEESILPSDSLPPIGPHAGMEPEHDPLLAESARLFRELQSEIECSFENAMKILKRDVVYIGRGLHSKLNAEDEHDLDVEIDQVNRNIWNARAKLDSYIKFTNSTPRFDLTLNLISQLYDGLKMHRKKRFYRIHVVQGNYYYPYFELTEALRKLKGVFSGHEGVLGVGADYIEKPPPLSQAGAGAPEQPTGGPYYPHTPWNPIYEQQPWRYPPAYDQEREHRRRRPPREIGDSEDSLW